MNYQDEIYQVRQQINGIKVFKIKRDLLKMLTHCENLHRQTEAARSNSRAKTTESQEVLYLRNQFNESFTHLQQYVTIALLQL